MKGIFWLLVGSVFEVRGVSGLYSCVSDYFPMFDPYEHLTLELLIYCSLLTFQFWVLCMAYAFGRRTLNQPIGRTVRSGVDVITLCAAIILRHCLPNCYYCIETLVSYTILLHCLGHLHRASSDIGFWDALLGALMQVLVYEMSNDVFASIAVVMLCCGVILYRYCSYSAPVMVVVDASKLESGDATLAC